LNADDFVADLVKTNQAAVDSWDEPPLSDITASSIPQLLKSALVSEISVADAASFWMPTINEWDVKIAVARQVGDEARHFQLVQTRLKELDPSADFQMPPPSGVFTFLRDLKTTVERIAAGMVALEWVAYSVNEKFLKACEAAGDKKTAAIYRDHIQPDEKNHFEAGRALLQKYAGTEAGQWRARAACETLLQSMKLARAAALKRSGLSVVPGC
jgi:hypothetical protein